VHVRREVGAREHVGEVTDENREGCEGPYLLQHVRVHEYVVVGARACDGVEGVLHLSRHEARIDPAPSAVEGKGNDLLAASRKIQAVPRADLRQIEVLVRDVGDVEAVLQRRGESGKVLLTAADYMQGMIVDP